jgi:hypothetical protein
MIVLAAPITVAAIRIGANIIRGITAGGPGSLKNVSRAVSGTVTEFRYITLACIITTNRRGRFMIVLAAPITVAAIRIGTNIIRGITAGGPGSLKNISRAVSGTVTEFRHITLACIITTNRRIRFMIVLTTPITVASIRTGTNIIRGITAGSPGSLKNVSRTFSALACFGYITIACRLSTNNTIHRNRVIQATACAVTTVGGTGIAVTTKRIPSFINSANTVIVNSITDLCHPWIDRCNFIVTIISSIWTNGRCLNDGHICITIIIVIIITSFINYLIAIIVYSITNFIRRNTTILSFHQ